MDALRQLYFPRQDLWNLVIAGLVFYGFARVAFWRERDGLRVGGALALGLAALLTVALIIWADENGRRIQEFGPWAAGIVVGAVVTLAVQGFRKAGRA